jgi:hypothetical protein
MIIRYHAARTIYIFTAFLDFLVFLLTFTYTFMKESLKGVVRALVTRG